LPPPSFHLDRLHLHPRDFGFESRNVPLESVTQVVDAMKTTLDGQPSEMMQSALWNGGFYLWRCGACPSIQDGIAETEKLLTQGKVKQKLWEIQQAIAPIPVAP
ncbi:MAG: hypothetical protein HC866_21875, partial [Leptolyngbyaceae cyanobacterium RU_5_1]|nr:hypothetical protein [Leptolyngbyaceae cyanobacterium RU_5_1]